MESDRLVRTWKSLTLFLGQLSFNAIWTPLFFGWHRIDWALVDIVILFTCLAATCVAFFRKSRLAGSLLLPYLAWVAFASVLNFEYWRLNRQRFVATKTFATTEPL